MLMMSVTLKIDPATSFIANTVHIGAIYVTALLTEGPIYMP